MISVTPEVFKLIKSPKLVIVAAKGDLGLPAGYRTSALAAPVTFGKLFGQNTAGVPSRLSLHFARDFEFALA